MLSTKPTFCFAGFGTDRLRCEEAMKTAGRRTPNCRTHRSGNRAHDAEGQNRSCSIKWAAKVEKFRPREECFFLTFPFIEQIRWPSLCFKRKATKRICPPTYDSDYAWLAVKIEFQTRISSGTFDG